MTVTSELEANRVDEIENLLNLIKPKIIDFIEKSNPESEKYEADSLGKYHEPEFLKTQILKEELNEGIRGNEEILAKTIDNILQYSVNTWNPGFMDKLYASNTPVGLISDILLSTLNTNSHVYTVSPIVSVIENYIGKRYASLFFEDNKETCGGLTFPGGSWSNITSLQIARSLKYPDTKVEGNSKYKFAIYTSNHCHYSVEKAATLLGLGSSNMFKIKVHKDGSMDTAELDKTMQKTTSEGYIPLYINATAGTTVFGSYDNIKEISKIAKKYNAWLHVDGSWGGNVVFSKKHKHKLNGCKFADSITVNPHKMLGVPNTCSFLLLPHVLQFQKSMSLQAPYLFHGREESADINENYDLADGTMGCGRRPDALKLYLSWLYYGHEGFERRIDHAFEIAKYFIHKISDLPNFKLVLGDKENFPSCLQVCFYYKPEGYTATDYTDVTRFISRELHRRGRYLIDFSPNPDQDDNNGEFFRVVFNSPILTDKVIDDLVESIISVGKEYKS